MVEDELPLLGGLFEWKAMPFGIQDSSSEHIGVRVMNTAMT